MLPLNRFVDFFRCFSATEIIAILYWHFLRKDLSVHHVNLHHALVVVIHCSDKGFLLKRIRQLIVIDFEENHCVLAIQLRKNTSDFFIFNQIFIRKDYADLVAKMKIAITPEQSPLIIDAGANIGCATLFFYAYFNHAQIIGVEPETSNFEMLKKNVEANHLKNVILKRAALWNTLAKLHLKSDFRDQSHAAFRVEESGGVSVGEGLPGCTVTQLTELVNYNEVTLLKIDIEGAEKIIFEDKKYLQSFLPHTRLIAVEVHEEMISESEITGILNEFHFVCEKSGEYLIGVNTTFAENAVS